MGPTSNKLKSTSDPKTQMGVKRQYASKKKKKVAGGPSWFILEI